MSYFDKVYVNEYNEIIVNAPIQLVETAIIKDTVDNTVLLRNIFTNVSSDVVIGIIIEGELFDIADEKVNIEGGFSFTYQDINIQPNELFGNKVPILLPQNVRRAKISIKKVVTANGEKIDYSNMEKIIPEEPRFITLPKKFLTTIDNNGSNPMVIFPLIREKYWQCMCGRINWLNDIRCNMCNRSINDQIDEQNLNALYKDYILEEERIKKENEEKEEARKKEALEIEKRRQQEEIERKHNEEIESQKKKKRTVLVFSAIGGILTIVIILLIVIFLIIPERKKHVADELKENHAYIEAIEQYEILDEEKYKSEIDECRTLYIEELVNERKYDEAEDYLLSIDGITSSSDQVKEIEYLKANNCLENKSFDEAIEIYKSLGRYSNSQDMITECKYQKAELLLESGDYENAYDLYKEIYNYKDVKQKTTELESLVKYDKALNLIKEEEYCEAIDLLEELGEYEDSEEYIEKYKEKAIESAFKHGDLEKCITYCKKFEIYNDYYYDSNYQRGKYYFEMGWGVLAVENLEAAKEKYPEVEEILKKIEKSKDYY